MTALSASRRVALRALAQIRRTDAYARPVIDKRIAAAALPAADAAFAARLAYQVIATQGTLDEALDPLLSHPRGIEPGVRDALRMGACELLFLRTPPSAAVSQAVEAARLARPQAARLANAVLRRLAERAPTFPWGDPATDRDALARVCAMPRWLTDLFLDDLGEQHGREALLAGLGAAPLFVRANPFKGPLEETIAALSADGAEPLPSPPDDAARRCARPARAARGSALAHGLAIVADAAAQVAPLAAAPRPGAHVLDVGAGRGTKSSMLQGAALCAGGPARVVAIDTRAYKLDVLETTMRRLGVPGVTTALVDATDPASLAELRGAFDVALIDAPCSGLGTLRRHPEKRWRLRPDDIDRLAQLQLRMLRAVSTVVRPGGLMVYSTCTVSAAETEGVIAAFLRDERGAGFSRSPLDVALPDEWARFVTRDGWFRSWPRKGGADGHFVAALVRGVR